MNTQERERFILALKQYNKTVNIYSRTAYDRLDFHITDSLVLAKIIGNTKKHVVDFGSGAGFPSFFMALHNSKNNVVSVESKAKKRHFLEQLKAEFQLSNWSIFKGDIREFLLSNHHQIDTLTAKAFGSIDKIMAYFKGHQKKPLHVLLPISQNQYEALSKTSSKLKLTLIKQIEGASSFYFAHYQV